MNNKMSFDEFITQFNKYKKEDTKRKNFRRDSLEKLKSNKYIGIDVSKVDKDMNYIALCILTKMDSNKEFKLGKEFTMDRRKLFVENGRLLSRSYKCKYKDYVRFLAHNEAKDILALLPASFSSMIKEIKEYINKETEKLDRDLYEKVDKNNSVNFVSRAAWRRKEAKIIDVYDKKLNIPAYCLTNDKDNSIIKVNINNIKANGMITYGGDFLYKIVISGRKQFENEDTDVDINDVFLNLNNWVYNEIKLSIKKCEEHSGMMKERMENILQRIMKIIMKYGYDKYLIIRNI